MERDTREAATLRGVIWTMLALIAIAIVSQGVHDVAIEHLGVPFPTIVHRPWWLLPVSDFVRLSFLVLVCRASRSVLSRYGLWTACLIVGALTVCLSETIRPVLIDLFRADGWLNDGWSWSVTSVLPGVFIGMLRGIVAVLLARLVWPRSLKLAVAGLALSAVLMRMWAEPLFQHVVTSLNRVLGIVKPEALHDPPYSGLVLLVIYVSFLEPTIASFVLARMSSRGLTGRTRRRLACFTLLILGASGRVTLMLLSTWFVHQPLGWRILSTGQFFAETAVMAILTGALALRRRLIFSTDGRRIGSY